MNPIVSKQNDGRMSATTRNGSRHRQLTPPTSLHDMMLLNPSFVSTDVIEQHEKYLMEYEEYTGVVFE